MMEQETVSKTQTLQMIIDHLVILGVVGKVGFTNNYDRTKPSEEYLETVTPKIKRMVPEYGGPDSEYLEAHIPVCWLVSEKPGTYPIGDVSHPITDREFFETSFWVRVHRDSYREGGDLQVSTTSPNFMSNTRCRQPSDLQPMIDGLIRLQNLLDSVTSLVRNLTVEESPEDFSWVKSVREERESPHTVEDDDHFCRVTEEYINEYIDDDRRWMMGLLEFLKSRGMTKKEDLDEFEYLCSSLQNDKSELHGSPDLSVCERFEEHCDELDTLLRKVDPRLTNINL